MKLAFPLTLTTCILAFSLQGPSQSLGALNANNSLRLSSLSFNDSGFLTDQTSGKSFPTKSMNFGVGLSFYRDSLISDNTPVTPETTTKGSHSSFGWSYEAGILFGQSHIANQNNDITYAQGGNSMSGVFGVIGTHVNLAGPKAHLGLSLPILYKTVQYSEPLGFSVKTKSKLIVFATADLSWQLFDHWVLSQRIGPALTENSTFWDISLSWIY